MKLKEFNKDKSINKLHIKRNKDKYITRFTLVLSLVIFIAGIIFFAYARYESEREFTLINATVGDFVSGDYTIAAYVDNVKSRSIPAKDSGYYLQKVECESGVGTWDSNNWSLTVEGATQQTKCYVYFTTLIAESDQNGTYATLSRYYPVGSIYVSTSSTSPADIFGGTWQALTDTMLMAKGSTFSTVNASSYTKDGGNASVTLTNQNLPNHTHKYTASGTVSSTFTGTRAQTEGAGSHFHNIKQYSTDGSSWLNNFQSSKVSNSQHAWAAGATTDTTPNHQHYFTPSGTVSSTFTGTSNQSTTACTNCNATAVDIMNPYKVVYMWVRTA